MSTQNVPKDIDFSPYSRFINGVIYFNIVLAKLNLHHGRQVPADLRSLLRFGLTI
jgi:hypothetical protein